MPFNMPTLPSQAAPQARTALANAGARVNQAQAAAPAMRPAPPPMPAQAAPQAAPMASAAPAGRPGGVHNINMGNGPGSKFSSRPTTQHFARGGSVQAESQSWAKSSVVSNKDPIKSPDAYRTDNVKQSYGKRGGSLGSGGTHGPNCGCALCKARWGS